MMTLLTIGAAVLIGLFLLAIEFFLVPGFSIPGIAAIFAIGYGIYLSYTEYGFVGSFVVLVASFLVSLVLVRAAVKSKTMRTFSLSQTQKGGIAVNDYSHLLNKRGVALTDLRPSGTAEFEQNRYSVVTDGEYIVANTEIVVTAVEGSRILVTPYTRG